MKHKTLTALPVFFDLQLFADGAGGAGTAAAESAPSAGEQAVYEGAPAAQAEAVPADLSAEFDELIKGKYKEQYGKKINDTVKNRLKGVHKELDAYKALAATIGDKYGFDDVSDVNKLIKAIDEAEAPGLAERAYANGVSEEVQKKIDKLEAVQKRYERQQAEREREEGIQRQYSAWYSQAEAMQNEFPGFDLEAEISNPEFRNLLLGGVDVRGAFIATHWNEITTNAMAYTAKKVEEGVINKIRAGAARPAENGTSPQSAISTKKSPANLTLAQMDELAERARRGERITF